MCPDRTYAILEGRDDLGGTWDLFRYPGVRSDSDMHTLGYRLQAVDGGQGHRRRALDPRLPARDDRRVRHRPPHPLRPPRHAGRVVERRRPLDGRGPPHRHRRDRHLSPAATCSCARATTATRRGYTPEFPGIERFAGQIVHPQAWPEDLDYAGKKVVVIGSGATAMTLIPAMAGTAGARHHAPALADLRRVPARRRRGRQRPAQGAARPRRLPPDPRQERGRCSRSFYQQTRTRPDKVKDRLLDMVRKELGPDYDVDTHFTPSYNPWDQRLCLVPNSDLFDAIRSGQASVVTDEIVTFTETGIELASGDVLEADIIVTATGLQLVTLGEMDFVVDGEPGRLRQDVDVQGLRLLRRPQPGVVVRLHQRVVDAARRPHVRVRLPAAEPHGRRRARRSARPGCARRTDRCPSGPGSTASRPATCSG